MANTYTKIHMQFVFAVKHRDSIIQKPWKDELYKYITGIVHNNRHKMLAINGMSDHIHLLIGMRPSQSVSDLLQDIKGGSSKWINEKKFVKGRFEWQEGYGGFSYSPGEINTVIDYINNHTEYHKTISFKDEYLKLLKQFEIEYDEKYVFKELV